MSAHNAGNGSVPTKVWIAWRLSLRSLLTMRLTSSRSSSAPVRSTVAPLSATSRSITSTYISHGYVRAGILHPGCTTTNGHRRFTPCLAKIASICFLASAGTCKTSARLSVVKPMAPTRSSPRSTSCIMRSGCLWRVVKSEPGPSIEAAARSGMSAR